MSYGLRLQSNMRQALCRAKMFLTNNQFSLTLSFLGAKTGHNIGGHNGAA